MESTETYILKRHDSKGQGIRHSSEPAIPMRDPEVEGFNSEDIKSIMTEIQACFRPWIAEISPRKARSHQFDNTMMYGTSLPVLSTPEAWHRGVVWCNRPGLTIMSRA